MDQEEAEVWVAEFIVGIEPVLRYTVRDWARRRVIAPRPEELTERVVQWVTEGGEPVRE